MSDYQKNIEYFELFRVDFAGYFDRYPYVYFKNKNKSDFVLWFLLDQGDFIFGYLKGLGGMAFFFDKQVEADTIEFSQIKGLMEVKAGMRVHDLDEQELLRLKRKIKRDLKDPHIVPQGVIPEEALRARKKAAPRRPRGAAS